MPSSCRPRAERRSARSFARFPQIVERRQHAGDAAPPRVVRIATHDDIVTRLKHEQREREAHRIAMLKIRERGLGMKVTKVEQLFDGSRLVFYFTADGRVDFRELVRELATEFRTRIEMRQIGVRDEAKMIGGYGTCGRPLCCTTFLTSFEPVSIKMAKQQDLSLNPSKLSGLCGRLKCCLRYELPNAKGVAHGGCGSEGGCDNPSGCGTGGCGSGSCGCRRKALNANVKPRVAITEGDPAGIGPEIARRAAADPRVLAVCEPVLYGAAGGRALRARCPFRRRPGAPRTTPSCAPRPTRSAASCSAIATAPINKEALRLAGLPWNGHTDLLAHLTGAAHVAMMFYSDELRVVLATVHVPLADVPRLLTRELMERTIALTARELPRFDKVRAADRRRRTESARGRARPVRPRRRNGDRAGHRAAAANGASTCRGRFRPTRSSCAPGKASSTSSSPAITIRA